MFDHKVLPETLLAGVLACGIVASPEFAQSETPAAKAAVVADAPAGKPAATATPFRFPENRMSRRAEVVYGLLWGVDSLRVKWAESGEMIRFSYRVVDAEKARVVNDKKAEPSLIDPQAGVSLVVPSLEKVGQLRQSSTPEEGKSYWMAFSNQGRRVKRGDHVNVVIGKFHVEGLVVE